MIMMAANCAVRSVNKKLSESKFLRIKKYSELVSIKGNLWTFQFTKTALGTIIR